MRARYRTPRLHFADELATRYCWWAVGWEWQLGLDAAFSDCTSLMLNGQPGDSPFLTRHLSNQKIENISSQVQQAMTKQLVPWRRYSPE